MKIRIGITGGIGSGKSVVSHLLELMGIPIYISDIEARSLMLKDEHIRQGLVDLLGEDVYVQQQLNKRLLASYLFDNPSHAALINAIVHPRVKEDFRRWAESHSSSALVGIESAILYEAGLQDEVDMVVMVYAPEEIRVARAMQRDGVSREDVVRRVHSQMNDEEKRMKADEIIVNDGKTPLIPQIIKLLQKLSAEIL